MPNGATDDWNASADGSLTALQQSERAEELVAELRCGDDQALAALFSLYRDRLLRLIDIRLDRSLQSRVDPNDVLQDAYIDAAQRTRYFLVREDASITVWLRLIVLQRLQLVVRHHLFTDKRDARRETLVGDNSESASFAGIAQLIVDSITSPSAAVARSESVDMVEKMLEKMPPNDREVLILRHFELLSNDEVAEILDISIKAASNRYVRALSRLKEKIEAVEKMEVRRG